MIGIEIDIPQRYRMAFDRRNVQAVLRSAGAEIAAVARRKVRQSVGSGRLYYGARKGSHRASLPGQPPTSWTGELANSIKVRPLKSGDGVLIRDAAFYALFLEAGARGGTGGAKRGVRGRRNAVQRRKGGNRVLAPRPFLSAAAAERSASIGPRVQEAIMKDVKFQRVAAGAKT
jgi:hypothetical protein